jgi:hypothetical protein
MRLFAVTVIGLSALICSLCASVAVASNADSLVVGDFIYKIETDTTHYLLGDSVTVVFTITYNGPEPETVWFVCWRPTHSVITVHDNIDTMYYSGCYPTVDPQVMQPGQSIVDVHFWDTRNHTIDEPAPPGPYHIEGFPAIAGGPDYYTIDVIIELLDPLTGIGENQLDAGTCWHELKVRFR